MNFANKHYFGMVNFPDDIFFRYYIFTRIILSALELNRASKVSKRNSNHTLTDLGHCGRLIICFTRVVKCPFKFAYNYGFFTAIGWQIFRILTCHFVGYKSLASLTGHINHNVSHKLLKSLLSLVSYE